MVSAELFNAHRSALLQLPIISLLADTAIMSLSDDTLKKVGFDLGPNDARLRDL